MELARIIPAALVGAGGILAVLVAMAAARDRRHPTNAKVALTGLLTLLVVACLTVAVATVLPVLAGWGVAFLLAMAIITLLHAH
ncbi:MAG TPA: hypothetical protein VGM75_37230 [Pseudonocardiaceae bacterium]|jgi:hypothetical protein